MKKNLVFFLLLLSVSISPLVALGQVSSSIPLIVPIPGQGNTTFSQTTEEPIDYLRAVYFWLIGFGALAALFMIVFGSVQYIASAGFPSLQSSAKQRILYAITGLIILLGATTLLTTFNRNVLSETSINEGIRRIEAEQAAAEIARQARRRAFPASGQIANVIDATEAISTNESENAYRGNPQNSPSFNTLRDSIIESRKQVFAALAYEDGDYEEDNTILAAHLKSIRARIQEMGNHPVAVAAFEAALQDSFDQHNFSDSNDDNLRDVYNNGGDFALESYQAEAIYNNIPRFGYLIPYLLAEPNDGVLDFPSNIWIQGTTPPAFYPWEDVLRNEYNNYLNSLK